MKEILENVKEILATRKLHVKQAKKDLKKLQKYHDEVKALVARAEDANFDVPADLTDIEEALPNAENDLETFIQEEPDFATLKGLSKIEKVIEKSEKTIEEAEEAADDGDDEKQDDE